MRQRGIRTDDNDARISTALPRHPKTVKLQRRPGVSGCWSLVCLFLWVAENRANGDLEGMTAEDIEIAASWTGQTGEFAHTLVDVGFLEGADGTYIVHDWYEHNPWAANRAERKKAAQDAANIRWERVRNASSMRDACEPHAQTSGLNSTEVAQAICCTNGWSGRSMIWALKDAIDFQSAQMPEASLEQVGEWLVKVYFDRRASKGDFAGAPQKFFQQALYRPGPNRRGNGKVTVPGDDLLTRTMAQLEAK